MRGGIWVSVCFGAVAALSPACSVEAASKAKRQITVEILKQAIASNAGNVQRVTFPDTGWDAVKVVRGNAPAHDKNPQKPAADKTEIAEIVSFADPKTRPVRILRGENERSLGVPSQPHAATAMTMQVVSFANRQDRPVSILRGSGFPVAAETELFSPASAADLDRVAFAVDGAESSHGADLRMWRPEPSGPQGPMQVTAAAAFDVGGGDRFDLAQNRELGRAYLARMYRRYGNWPDAIAAYNWGPGNLDAWIGGGRAADKLPLMVERYRGRVLHEAALAEPGMAIAKGWPLSATPVREPANAAPVPASVAAAFVADALQRAATVGGTAFGEFAAALRSRAADWKSAYAGLAGLIVSLTQKRSARDFEAEYAVSSDSAD
jgi:transglycosylase-like protein with SLT domain